MKRIEGMGLAMRQRAGDNARASQYRRGRTADPNGDANSLELRSLLHENGHRR